MKPSLYARPAIPDTDLPSVVLKKPKLRHMENSTVVTNNYYNTINENGNEKGNEKGNEPPPSYDESQQEQQQTTTTVETPGAKYSLPVTEQPRLITNERGHAVNERGIVGRITDAYNFGTTALERFSSSAPAIVGGRAGYYIAGPQGAAIGAVGGYFAGQASDWVQSLSSTALSVEGFAGLHQAFTGQTLSGRVARSLVGAVIGGGVTLTQGVAQLGGMALNAAIEHLFPSTVAVGIGALSGVVQNQRNNLALPHSTAENWVAQYREDARSPVHPSRVGEEAPANGPSSSRSSTSMPPVIRDDVDFPSLEEVSGTNLEQLSDTTLRRILEGLNTISEEYDNSRQSPTRIEPLTIEGPAESRQTGWRRFLYELVEAVSNLPQAISNIPRNFRQPNLQHEVLEQAINVGRRILPNRGARFTGNYGRMGG